MYPSWVHAADLILRTPPIAVAALSLAAMIPIGTRSYFGDYWALTVSVSPFMWLYAFGWIAWAYALYGTARKRTGASAQNDRTIVFGATLICFVVAVPIAALLYVSPGSPDSILIGLSFTLVVLLSIFGLVAAWLAATALTRFEAERGVSRPAPEWATSLWRTVAALTLLPKRHKASLPPGLLTFLAISSSLIGIWFLYPRVTSLLSIPVAAEGRA